MVNGYEAKVSSGAEQRLSIHFPSLVGTGTPMSPPFTPHNRQALLSPFHRCVLNPLHSTPLNLKNSAKLRLPPVILAYR